jgi:regulator of protease activity HflC (stomatin/prohibitin superfamily)
MPQVIGLAVVAVLIFFLASQSIRTVKQWEMAIVERFGQFRTLKGPGLNFIIPFVEAMTKVDMREHVVDVPPQEVITKDNVVVTVDAVVYYQPTDPVKLKYNIANFILAATKLAQTNLRNVVGSMTLDDALTSRDTINTQLREILDDATDPWGTKVVRVEIQRVEPPPDVTDAMHRQMKAERIRRAVVLEAEGDKRSKILQSEGVKQSAILRAQGEAEAIKEVADAQKYEKIALATGEAQGIEVVYGAIHAGDPTNDLIAIKYLDALAAMADGKGSTIFMPIEASGMLGSIGAIKELFDKKPNE